MWDGLQEDNRCCGVDGPLDYNTTWWQAGMALEVNYSFPLPHLCYITSLPEGVWIWDALRDSLGF